MVTFSWQACSACDVLMAVRMVAGKALHLTCFMADFMGEHETILETSQVQDLKFAARKSARQRLRILSHHNSARIQIRVLFYFNIHSMFKKSQFSFI